MFRISIPLDKAATEESRVTVFRAYAIIKKVTGATYDKKTSAWALDTLVWFGLIKSQVSLILTMRI